MAVWVNWGMEVVNYGNKSFVVVVVAVKREDSPFPFLMKGTGKVTWGNGEGEGRNGMRRGYKHI